MRAQTRSRLSIARVHAPQDGQWPPLEHTVQTGHETTRNRKGHTNHNRHDRTEAITDRDTHEIAQPVAAEDEEPLSTPHPSQPISSHARQSEQIANSGSRRTRTGGTTSPLHRGTTPTGNKTSRKTGYCGSRATDRTPFEQCNTRTDCDHTNARAPTPVNTEHASSE
jgi:hypothetical protein